MKILYGTTNQAKLESMRRIMKTLGVEIIGLNELQQPLPFIEESGKNPLENAEIKARIYYETFSMPVFSCDSGLYFDDVEDSFQPGTRIRRVNGKELTDEEMIEYYADLARKYNNKLIGRYRNAICFIADDSTIFRSMDEALATEPFMIVSVPHEKRNPGFPLDSLSVDISTGEYYYDLKEKTVDKSAIDEGFQSFFIKALSVIEEKHKKYVEILPDYCCDELCDIRKIIID